MGRLTQSGIRDLNWSPAEKAIARRAFDAALKRNFESVIQKTKKLAETIRQPSDVWDLERYLGKQRTQIDQTFDYRYSVLPNVFADLIRSGQLRESELQGLSDDKLELIRRLARS